MFCRRLLRLFCEFSFSATPRGVSEFYQTRHKESTFSFLVCIPAVNADMANRYASGAQMRIFNRGHGISLVQTAWPDRWASNVNAHVRKRRYLSLDALSVLLFRSYFVLLLQELS
jgi:hypothetical protein